MPEREAIERRLAPALAVLRRAIEKHAFPGASLAVAQENQPAYLYAMGRFTYRSDSPLVTTDTMYDLASVSKVVATTAVAMVLYQRGELELDAPVAAILPGFAQGDERRRSITVRMLLLHSSGLPAYERLFERAADRTALLSLARQIPLSAEPGARIEYSDIGFIILGELLERLAGEPLDRYAQREIFGPLGMCSTCFCPAAALREKIPPTEDDRSFRHRIVQGEVHDENAWVMGGVAGHAGLFSTAADVARFAAATLGANPVFRRETVECFTQAVALGGKRHALGWDVPNPPSQSGSHFSSRSYGHLGFTGTSLWIDPERRVIVVLLTNRTWPDRTSQAIKSVRPEFHDAVMQSV